jgi:hypothetical protein
MKSLLLTLAILTCSQLFALDRDVMLEAIRLKENSHGMVGKLGERGDWQLMPSTVKDCGGYDRAAAMKHLLWVEENLQRKGIDPSPYNCALVWNAGLKRVVSGKAPERAYLYARDAEALYNARLHR